MANEEHVALLRQGVDTWNVWRRKNPDTRPDLSGVDLTGTDLTQADLSTTSLEEADLRGADLFRADLIGARLNNANLSKARLFRANLTGAYLFGADLTKADLTSAHLAGAALGWATLANTKLHMADLTNVHMVETNLFEAELFEAHFINTNLIRADLTGASLFRTVFGDIDLTEVKGLDQCRHEGPCIIDYWTLQKSSSLPMVFLRGVGLPESLISLANQLHQFYSCFISYSTKDQEFAERLHADLQNKGVRCWFAPHDMPIGAKIIDALDEAIRLRDKVLLILSEEAVTSDWVEGEVTRALDEEREREQTILFPVRIDDTVMQTPKPWTRVLRGQRNIGDFTRWKDHDSYQRSFERLIRDLKVEPPRNG